MSSKFVQGQDPKGAVFSGLYPVLYAAESPVSGSYVDTSKRCAAYADALLSPNGLRDAHVLDLGCGHGTTTFEIANYKPNSIVAIDSSSAMLELMQAILKENSDLDAWLKAKGAEEILGDLYEKTLRDLLRRRYSFQTGHFARAKGSLTCKHLLNADRDLAELRELVGDGFDAVIGNNMLHWPVNAKKAALKKHDPDLADDELTRLATLEALKNIRSVVRHGGVVVLEEPKDFITFDDEPEIEKDIEYYDRTKHPVFLKINKVFNKTLKEMYGIDRPIPTTTGLFGLKKLHAWCEEAGFAVQRIAHIENTLFTTDPATWCYIRFFMWVGNLDLSFDTKMELLRITMAETPKVLTAEDLAAPMRYNDFYICLKAV